LCSLHLGPPKTSRELTNAHAVHELEVEGAVSETTGNMLRYAADSMAHLWQVRQVEESHCIVRSHSCILHPTNYK